MKKLVLIILTLLISTFAFAYEWDSIGPSSVEVNNFNTVFYNVSLEILCTSDGILINEGDNWAEYTSGGLPAWSAVGLDPNNILVLLGDGSWSDGVYKFNLTSHQFDVVEYIPFPNFLQYCEFDSTYYTGGEYGMWKSTDGISFVPIDFFYMNNCKAFAFYENHFVVSAGGEIYFSPDYGETWTQAPTSSPSICDMSFHNDGTLFGILPDDSYSSGLWSSNNFGEHWNVELWDMYMSTVGIDLDGNIFVGWENYGVSQWNPETQELTSFDDDLPDLHINKITSHADIDCINIVACTDSGAYILTNYTVGLEEIIPGFEHFSLSNFPNPFDNTTTIVFSLDETSSTNLSVYDVFGNKVATLFSGSAESGKEYSIDFSETALSQSVYYYQLQTESKINAVKKMMLVE